MTTESSNQSPNTIAGYHVRTDGINTTKAYHWHIPKALRYKNITRGSFIQAYSRYDKSLSLETILVVDVYRENIEDTGRKYRPVIDIPKSPAFLTYNDIFTALKHYNVLKIFDAEIERMRIFEQELGSNIGFRQDNPDEKELIRQARNILSDVLNGIEPNKLPTELSSATNFNSSTMLIVSALRALITTDSGMWAYMSRDFLDVFAKYLKGKKVLDPFAGRGWLARGLRNRDIDVIATDLEQWPALTEMNEYIDALDSVKKYGQDVDVVVLSWVPYGSNLDYKILKELRKEKYQNIQIIWIGELDGASGSKKFNDFYQSVDNPALTPSQRAFQSYWGLHDILIEVK